MIKEGTVETTISHAIAKITFAHPQHNSMPSTQLVKLTASILEQGSNPDVKIILLQSAGDRTFCAGANFDQLLSIQDFEEGTDFFMGFARLILAIRDCGKLVIGRVQGKAVGGGVGLLAATDYCMATRWAAVRLSELSIGIGPYVIEPAIRRKAGIAAVSQLALNPQEWQTAEWAQSQGLFQEIFENSEQMDDYMNRYLASMTSYSGDALRNMKEMLWEGTEDWQDKLEDRAQRSASLLLNPLTQSLLRKMADRS